MAERVRGNEAGLGFRNLRFAAGVNCWAGLVCVECRGWVPYETLGTWTTQLTEYLYEREDFLLIVRSPDEAPQPHHRFLDRRIPLPLHPGWSDWLWKRGLRTAEIKPLKGERISAYWCRPDVDALRTDLAASVSVGELVVARSS